MRQVPHYLLIGNGRLSRHLQHYFTHLNLPFSVWHRGQPQSDLTHKISHASHILVLIRDDAIDSFIQAFLQTFTGIIIHCSGSLKTDLAYGAHPLMTFNTETYSLETYHAISFVIDANAPEFSTLFPGLTNPHYRLEKSLKTKYHAMCVMANNFSCLLWQTFFKTLEEDFHLPKTAATPFLMQTFQNLKHNPENALTGPIARKDFQTIEKHLAVLKNHPLEDLYKSFLQCFLPEANERVS